MLFLLEWKVKNDCVDKALLKFVQNQQISNTIENAKIIEIYHLPGSLNGFIVAETNNVINLQKYIDEEGDFKDWNIIPVLRNDEALAGLSYQLKSIKKN